MQESKVIEHIVAWLKNYAESARSKGFIIGISGGIDSAVTSLLCAKTGLDVVCLEMNIHQNKDEVNRALAHIENLKERYSNVKEYAINLTDTFESLKGVLPSTTKDHGLSMANTRSRLRMTTLYAVGQSFGLLVAGTGNKVEDFGVGFYTKYGDGGVDLSPIADLTKTEVYALAKAMDVIPAIQKAAPTDGLWKDERTDEGQLGATYPELEWAMAFEANPNSNEEYLDTREREILKIYRSFHNANKHKMVPIPVCTIPLEIK
ncbi:NAD(+) synthase [Crocinitomix algicola]|uniref:NAD(+) synthase n=1 Tax=Crocinitomix algicola TaxID=1740263 RepID=UPI000872C547|nr:NAD(+) synthase [Crocinitomix algicola]